VSDRTQDRKQRRAALNAQAISTAHLRDSLGSQAAKGGMIVVGAQGYRFFFQLLSSAIMARLLVPEDFGLMAMSMAVTAFVSMFTDLGLSSATVQRQKIDQDTVSGLMFVGIFAGLLVMLVAFALAPLAAMLFDDPRVMMLIVVSAAAIPVGALSAQHLALMSRRMEFLKIQLITMISLTLSMSIALLLAWQTEMGYWALVVNNWLNTIILGVLLWTLSPWRPSQVRSWDGVRESFNFGAFLTGYSLVEYLHRQSDNVLIGWKFGAESLGFYSRAYGLFMLPASSLIYPFFEIAKPVLSRALDDHAEYRMLFHRMLLPLNFLTCALAGLLFLIAPAVVILVYGDQWQATIPLFRALSVSMVVQAITISLGWIYISTGRSKAMFYAQIVSAGSFFSVFLIAVHINLKAVAVAYSGVSIVLLLPLIWLAVRDSPFTLRGYLKIHMPLPLAATGATYLTYLLVDLGSGRLLDYLLCCLLFLGLYLVLVFIFASVSTSFRSAVVDLLKIAYTKVAQVWSIR
jgi:polysaccharide transporter, PST family